jgi:hypothetical protein
MNVSELLQELGNRSGYDTDKLKDIVTNPALMGLAIPDDFKSTINTGLLTIKEAQINPEIKKHFTGVVLGNADATLNELMDEYQFGDDIKSTLKSEQSTYARMKLFTKALADVKDQHAASMGGDKNKIVSENSELRSQLLAKDDKYKNDLSATEIKWLNKFMDTSINSHFEKYDYAMEGVPSNIQAMTARQLFDQKLNEKGGKQKYIDGKIVLVSATDDALPFTIDNKQVEFNSFADSVVYENKLARVKGSMPAPPQGNTPQPNMPANKILAPAAKAATSQALADLRAGS